MSGDSEGSGQEKSIQQESIPTKKIHVFKYRNIE